MSLLVKCETRTSSTLSVASMARTPARRGSRVGSGVARTACSPFCVTSTVRVCMCRCCCVWNTQVASTRGTATSPSPKAAPPSCPTHLHHCQGSSSRAPPSLAVSEASPSVHVSGDPSGPVARHRRRTEMEPPRPNRRKRRQASGYQSGCGERQARQEQQTLLSISATPRRNNCGALSCPPRTAR